MKKDQELIVITKTYDLILWSCNHPSKFPATDSPSDSVEANGMGSLEPLPERGRGRAAELINRLFRLTCGRVGLNQHPWPVSADAFRRPGRSSQGRQRLLFE